MLKTSDLELMEETLDSPYRRKLKMMQTEKKFEEIKSMNSQEFDSSSLN